MSDLTVKQWSPVFEYRGKFKIKFLNVYVSFCRRNIKVSLCRDTGVLEYKSQRVPWFSFLR